MSAILESVFDLEPERFQQSHTVIYLFGILIFLLCFLLQRAFGFMNRVVSSVCGSCFDMKRNVNHSTDIYKELSPEDRKHEYYMTNLKIKKNKSYLIENQDEGLDDLMSYYTERLKLKQTSHKTFLALKSHLRKSKRIKRNSVGVLDLAELAQSMTARKYKISGLYSYNILDHPDFLAWP